MTSAITNEQKEVLESMEATAKKYSDKKTSEPKEKRARLNEDAQPAKLGEITHFPSTRDLGDVTTDELRLTATIAGSIYGDSLTRQSWEKSLNETVPDLDDADDKKKLNVRFLDQGMKIPGTERLNIQTPFTCIITGATMILAWRGTYGAFDALADIKFATKAPWSNEGYPDLLVQGAFWEKVKDDLESHKDQLVNYITGKYMKDVNAKLTDDADGIPVKRILLTGHSLGGGLAQLAHVALTLPSSDNSSLSAVIKEHKVQVRTLGFAAPMSIALDSSNSTTTTSTFLESQVEPYMNCFVYSMDVVPRGYANLTFINSFVDAVVGIDISNPLLKAFVEFHVKIMENKEEYIATLTTYRHVGKVVYYDSMSAKPRFLQDTGFPGSSNRSNFYSIKYQPSSDVVKMALQEHGGLVASGAGLAYPYDPKSDNTADAASATPSAVRGQASLAAITPS